MMNSLLSRLLVLLAVALAPALGFAVYTEIEARKTHERAVHELALRVVNLASAEQQRIAEGARQTLTVLADFAGQIASEPVACGRRLGELRLAFARYAAFRLVAADGRVVCSANAAELGASEVGQPYFRDALATGRFVGAAAEPAGGRAGWVMALPWRDAGGGVAGVVAAELSLPWLQQLVDGLPLPAGADFTISDRDGIILARRPNDPKLAAGRMPASLEQFLTGGAPGTLDAVGPDGVTRVYGFSPLNLEPVGLGISVGLEREKAFPHLAAADRRQTELIALGGLLAAGLLAIGAHRLIRKPVGRLLAVAARWQQGDTTARAGFPSDGSEFSRLGAAFDAMAAAQERREQALRDALAVADLARAALADNETRLRLALASAEVAVFEIDLRRRRVWLDERAVPVRRSTIPINEWLPLDAPAVQAWIASIHPEDRPKREQALLAALRGEVSHHEVEYRCGSAQRGWQWLADRGVVIERDKMTGRAMRLVGVTSDVTARRDAEAALERVVAERTAALREREARFRGIFDSAFQLTSLLAPDGILLEANQAALGFGKVAAADVLNRPIWSMHWVADDPERAARLRRSVARAAAGEFVRYEVEVSFPGHEAMLIDFSLKPLRDEAGQVVLLIAEGRDITERSRLQAQLAQAQKMEAVGQLTGGVAHDFNNLLQALTGNLDLIHRLAEARGDARLVRLSVNAQRAATRGARLTQQLLAFSRKQNLRPERVWVSRLVGEMGDLLRRAAGETIEVRTETTADMWPCHADPAQFESAVLNLVLNARDAMPRGGSIAIAIANVTVDAARGAVLDTLPGDYVRVDVADTGSGILPEHLSRIFEPFFTTKEVGKGSGLGLAMVHGFARQSGGAVTIGSEIGSGTTVSLFLPRHLGESAEGSGRGPGHAGTAPVDAGRLHVLLVEDDPDVLDAVQLGLVDAGHRVIPTRDGQEALDVLASAEIVDIMVSDVVLPGGMSGVTVAGEARLRRPGLRVLLTSGYAEDVHALPGGGARGYEVLAKPFTNAELLQRVARLAEVAARERVA